MPRSSFTCLRSVFTMGLYPKDTEGTSDPALRLGLRSIKGLAQKQATHLVMQRMATGPFMNRGDFDRRTSLDKRSLKQLASAGALDCFTFTTTRGDVRLSA